LDVAGAARPVNEPKRRPDRMIAAQDEGVAGAAANRFHAPAIRLYAGCPGIMKVPAVHRAPEVGVEFEVSTAPVPAHCAKNFFKVLLDLRVRTIQGVPGSVTPSSKRHPVGRQRFTVVALHEPICMLLEDSRTLLGHKRSDPDSWFKTSLANLLQDCYNIAAKRPAGFQPVAHRRLIAIVNLDIFQLRQLLRNDIQVL